MGATSDSSLVCGLMEPMPELPMYWCGTQRSPFHWWELVAIAGGGMAWYPERLTLDRIHEVENVLTDSQKQRYMSHVASPKGLKGKFYDDAWVFLHATTDQKINALAATIGRPEGLTRG